MHKVLARMNFDPIIRGIIKCLYTRVQSAILSNGTLSEFFDVHRGVRQGCPLSPLLFVLVSECFGQLVRSCKEIQSLTFVNYWPPEYVSTKNHSYRYLNKVLMIYLRYISVISQNCLSQQQISSLYKHM
jgi:hypothetical protein